MDGVQPRDIRGRAGGGLFQLSGGGAVRVISITLHTTFTFFTSPLILAESRLLGVRASLLVTVADRSLSTAEAPLCNS